MITNYERAQVYSSVVTHRILEQHFIQKSRLRNVLANCKLKKNKNSRISEIIVLDNFDFDVINKCWSFPQINDLSSKSYIKNRVYCIKDTILFVLNKSSRWKDVCNEMCDLLSVKEFTKNFESKKHYKRYIATEVLIKKYYPYKMLAKK